MDRLFDQSGGYFYVKKEYTQNKYIENAELTGYYISIIFYVFFLQ